MDENPDKGAADEEPPPAAARQGNSRTATPGQRPKPRLAPLPPLKGVASPRNRHPAELPAIPVPSRPRRRRRPAVLATTSPPNDPTGQTPAAVIPLRGAKRRSAADGSRTDDCWTCRLLDRCGDGFVVVDAQHRLVYANDGATYLTGYDRVELAAMHFPSLLTGEGTTRVVEALGQLGTWESTWADGVAVQRRDGSIVPVELRLNRPPGQEHAVVAMLWGIDGGAGAQQRARSLAAHPAVTADRDRIAQALHDDAIRQLFGAGLLLHTAATMTHHLPASTRIWEAIEGIDRAIAGMRTAVFDLENQ